MKSGKLDLNFVWDLVYKTDRVPEGLINKHAKTKTNTKKFRDCADINIFLVCSFRNVDLENGQTPESSKPEIHLQVRGTLPRR